MKNKKFNLFSNRMIVTSSILCIISIIMIFIGLFLVFYDVRKMDADGNYNYICVAETIDSNHKVSEIYKLKVNSSNKVVSVFSEKKYFYYDESDYWNALYSFGTRNVDYVGDKENFIITINGLNGELHDESGNVINPNYLEYIKLRENFNYKCSFEKK